jgi:hypothetical protein
MALSRDTRHHLHFQRPPFVFRPGLHAHFSITTLPTKLLETHTGLAPLREAMCACQLRLPRRSSTTRWKWKTGTSVATFSSARKTTNELVFTVRRNLYPSVLLGYCVCALRGALEHCVRLTYSVLLSITWATLFLSTSLSAACDHKCICGDQIILASSPGWWGQLDRALCTYEK